MSRFALATRGTIHNLHLVTICSFCNCRLAEDLEEAVEAWKEWNDVTSLLNHQQTRDFLKGCLQACKAVRLTCLLAFHAIDYRHA
jgi:hypothetical protein